MPIQKKSRLARTQEKEAKSALVKYFIFTIAIFAFIVLVGLPLIIPRLTQFIDDTTGRTGGGRSGDTTPPPPPNLRDIPRFTKETTLEVRGSTEPGANVFLIVNGRDNEMLADIQGNFSANVNLMAEEANEIFAFAEDEAGNRSADSQSYVIVVDKEAPQLEIIKPKDGSIFFGQENYVEIEGQTEVDASVRINDRVAIVNREGKFNSRFSLNEGGNNFDIIAIDEAGNETKITISVSYSP